MTIRECYFPQASEILAIFNEAILNSTAIYDYRARTMAQMEKWFEAKEKGRYPVIGAFDEDASLIGFATYGPFRSWPGYKYSVEHAVYVRKDQRGKGLGKRLLLEIVEQAASQGYHMVIGGIDAVNTASIRLHQTLGFSHCASIKQAGFKFGRWLDLEFYQRILPTPLEPNEETEG
jgi:L-amino acid N-acyltransferase